MTDEVTELSVVPVVPEAGLTTIVWGVELEVV
jgi:hypothetical protein